MRHLAHPVAKTPRRPLHHAVVLGGSVVGLLAARILSDQFEHVTLIERTAPSRARVSRKAAICTPCWRVGE